MEKPLFLRVHVNLNKFCHSQIYIVMCIINLKKEKTRNVNVCPNLFDQSYSFQKYQLDEYFIFDTHKKNSPRNIYVYFIKFIFLINFYLCVFFWNQIFQILHGHLFNKLIDMVITPTSSHFQFNMHNQNLSALDIMIQWYLSRISSLLLFISHELCRRYTMGHVKSPQLFFCFLGTK